MKVYFINGNIIHFLLSLIKSKHKNFINKRNVN